MNSATKDVGKASGNRCRSYSLALVAFAMVAMMLLVPVLSAADSDAFTDGSKGYVVKVKDGATADELSAAGINKTTEIANLVKSPADMLRFSPTATAEAKSFSCAAGNGAKISGTTATTISNEEANATGITATFTFSGGESVLAPSYYLDNMEEEVGDAIVDYLGITTYSAGDVLEVTGDVDSRFAMKEETEYMMIDDTHCVADKETNTVSIIESTSLTYTYRPVSGDSKSFTYKCDVRGESSSKTTYSYDGDKSAITDGTKGTATTTYSATVKSNTAYWTVSGTKYDMSEPTGSMDPETHSITADVMDPADFTVDNAPIVIPSIDSSDHIEVTKTYDAVNSEYSSINSDATKSKSKIGTYVAIGVGVAVIVGIAAVAFVSIRKSLKQ